MTKCPECQSLLCEYSDECWTDKICWNCGYYESNTPAFKKHPEFFKNMVRENPMGFMKKFLIRRIFTAPKPDDNFTEPFLKIPELVGVLLRIVAR
jgi:hypothetical protein